MTRCLLAGIVCAVMVTEDAAGEGLEAFTANDDLNQVELTRIENSVSDVSGSLSYFVQLAIENHPALGVASADVAAAKHRALQAGLSPNPKLGIFADEVGNADSAGLIGVYLQRNIVRGGKLEHARRVKCCEANVLAQAQRQQLQRVQTDVETEFYRLLVAQQRVKLTTQLKILQADAVANARALNDAAETPLTDLLQTQVQAGHTELKLKHAEIAVVAAWRGLATAVSFPDLTPQAVHGSLDEITEPFSFDEMLLQTLNTSPQRQAASAAIDHARARLRRALAGAVPDFQTQVTAGQDTSTDDFYAGFQLQVPLMIHDRNQGNIAAARTAVVRSEAQLEKTELLIARRLAKQFEQYDAANAQVEIYNSRLIPKARETLELVSVGYREGEINFLQLLAAQQSLLDLTLEYLDALETLWNARQQIAGGTLIDALNN